MSRIRNRAEQIADHGYVSSVNGQVERDLRAFGEQTLVEFRLHALDADIRIGDAEGFQGRDQFAHLA